MSTYVRTGGKMLKVADDAVQRYLLEGYDVVDERGVVITKAIPRDTNTLTLEYKRLTAENKALKAKVATLEAELASVKAEASKPAETKADEAEAPAPKRQRKSKTEVAEE